VRVLIAPESFAGTLTAPQAASAIAEGWRRHAPHDDLVLCPLSDGGAGFVDALHTVLGGELLSVPVAGPFREPVPGAVLLMDDTPDAVGGGKVRTAFVESAHACGLHLVPEPERNPLRTTTAGVGSLLQTALDAGATRIVVGLGACAALDGGAGALATLDAGDPRLLASGGGGLDTLTDGALAGLPQARARFDAVELVLATEEDVPLLGFKGAAASFGARAGATGEQAQHLDRALGRFAQVALETLGPQVAPQRLLAVPGAGASGGLGFGLELLGGRLQPGALAVLDAVSFSGRVAGCDLVVTGEGCFDWQSLRGGVVAGVANEALAAGVPAIVLAGQVEVGRRETVSIGIESAYAVATRPAELPAALADPAGTLADRGERVARTWSR
jgi:glycerate 2-kinase